MDEANTNIEAYRVDHLPIVREYAEKIGLVEVINRLVPSEMDLKPGVVILAMVLDTLSGRSPLYRLENFLESQDTQLLFGHPLEPCDFNDDAVGRVLEKVFETGTMKIFTELATRALVVFGIDKSGKVHVHYDTTSISVWGDYDLDRSEDNPPPFLITHGHSKDHRPDLKQFLISLLCVERNIPIFGKLEDGNTSDKTANNAILTNISKRMAEVGLEAGACVYIADSAMITEDNLKATGDTLLFISRLPATYSECGRVIAEAVKKDSWDEVGAIAQTKPTIHRPATYYKVYETEVVLYEKTYRAVVVHSSAHDQRRQKRIDKQLEKERHALEAQCTQMEKGEYFCRPDAEAAAQELRKMSTGFYQVQVTVEERPHYKRGRPSKEGPREIKEMRYGLRVTVEEKTEAVSVKRQEAGCFVLVSNIAKEQEPAYDNARSILEAYKEQYGIEQNYSFLKDPVIVNDLFLKKPERIEALGLVLLIALLIWRLMEKSLRQYTESGDKPLIGWNKRPTNRPTSFMMITKFVGITVIKIGDQRKLQRPLSEAQKGYLAALGVETCVFTTYADG
jgi:transposase